MQDIWNAFVFTGYTASRLSPRIRAGSAASRTTPSLRVRQQRDRAERPVDTDIRRAQVSPFLYFLSFVPRVIVIPQDSSIPRLDHNHDRDHHARRRKDDDSAPSTNLNIRVKTLFKTRTTTTITTTTTKMTTDHDHDPQQPRNATRIAS